MKYLFLIWSLTVLCPWSNAQKIGHINYGNLLESLPQVKAADAELKTYQDSLGTALASMQEALDKRVAESQAKFQAGEMTKVEANQINQALNQEQQRLNETQAKAERNILQRRRDMLEPIVLSVRAIIEAYAKEHGYKLIFDESTGFILFDQPADDLTEVIRSIAAQE